MHPIATERLVLRNFAPGDAEGLFAYMHEPRASCFASDRLATLADAHREVAERMGSDDHIAVALKSTGAVIGDLFSMFEEPDTFNIGWNFSAGVEGRGYASEAARAFVDHLFTARAARRLYAYVEVGNSRSQKLCERLGMRYEGTFVEFVSFGTDAAGTPLYEDTQQFALLKREWAAAAA